MGHMNRTLAGLLLSCLLFGSSCRPEKDQPFGSREAFLRVVDSALQNYAYDHNGYFPDKDDPFTSLKELYPDYSGSGVELAGLSGSIAAVTNALQSGRSISNLTSWMYVPGLHTNDDPNLAILWETRPGMSHNGRFINDGSRPVLLLGQDVVAIAAKDWSVFLEQQQQMRQHAQKARSHEEGREP